MASGKLRQCKGLLALSANGRWGIGRAHKAYPGRRLGLLDPAALLVRLPVGGVEALGLGVTPVPAGRGDNKCEAKQEGTARQISSPGLIYLLVA